MNPLLIDVLLLNEEVLSTNFVFHYFYLF
jgi:hypothetical protein